VQKWAVKFTNFVWPMAMRSGKDAFLWGLKLVAGSTVLASLAKILHEKITHG